MAAMLRILLLMLALLPSVPAAEPVPDWRHISNGWEIPTETYSDQPYIVKTDDGAWLVCMTTGSGREGETGQHIVTLRSTDRGRSWEPQVDVEPADGPEASYAVLLKAPGGRVFVFYNHNTDNLRQVKADSPPYADGWCRRVDSLGHFVFKYSDDHGRTWSRQRYEIPQRTFEIDRDNAYAGAVKFFWNVGKAFIHDGAGYVPIIKVGGFGEGFFTSNEGALLRSSNILTEPDAAKIRWETLPDGDIGLRTPPGGGPIAGEQSYSVLSDGSFYVVYRTIDGHPAESYSRDGGRTWETPRYKAYADGRLMKHPRAANFAWRCENGKHLYWFHNHGGRQILEHPNRRTMAFQDRNPVWLSAGKEIDGPNGRQIRWSQPEIALYDDDTFIRMSYPDLVEDGGEYYLTETQKDLARVHRIDPELLDGLFTQFDNRTIVRKGILLELPIREPVPLAAEMPRLPAFIERSRRADHGTADRRAGFTVELTFRLRSLQDGQVLLDNRTSSGKGFALQTTNRGTIELVLNDGRTELRWDTDPGMIRRNQPHHLVAVVDGGPKIISFIVDGKLCDGGDYRQFGWGRFSPDFYDANGDGEVRIAPDVEGEVVGLRIYGRYLRVSEAIGNYRAGKDNR
jgi:BNR repeat protein/concanavalin A-like lectin/glucanase superfamily protein